MNNKKQKALQATRRDQRSALASPLRLEIIGLYTSPEPLAIADMAALMGRSAGSLYHHVGLLEKAGLLQRVGTRPKGKRHEALFRPTADRIEFATAPDNAEAAGMAVKTMAAAFRMAERDLAAALQHGNCEKEGPQRNLMAARIHLRASPKLLAGLNRHLRAIEELLAREAAKTPRPSALDEHLSLTIALLPLKGRGQDDPNRG